MPKIKTITVYTYFTHPNDEPTKVEKFGCLGGTKSAKRALEFWQFSEQKNTHTLFMIEECKQHFIVD